MKAPTKTRIKMFKKLLRVTAQSLLEGDAGERRAGKNLEMVRAALCWAHGCDCQAAEDFETMCLGLAQSWEGRLVNAKGEPLDVLKALATGRDT